MPIKLINISEIWRKFLNGNVLPQQSLGCLVSLLSGSILLVCGLGNEEEIRLWKVAQLAFICSKHQNNFIDVILVSLLST